MMTGKQRSVGAGSVCTNSIRFIIAIALLTLAGCYQPNPQVDREEIQKMADPEAYLLSLLDQRYVSPDIHCELGRYYHRQGQDAKALHHFETALGFDPVHHASQAAMIKMRLDQGQANLAQELMQRYQRQIIHSPQQMVELGLALDAENLDSYALSCFQQALELAPNLAPTNKHMGLYYFRNNDLERAKEYLIRSFEIDSNQPEVARYLGELGITVEVPVDYGTGTSPQ